MTKIITHADLRGCSLAELQALHQSVQRELVRSKPGTAERRGALACLEAISLAMAERMTTAPRP